MTQNMSTSQGEIKPHMRHTKETLGTPAQLHTRGSPNTMPTKRKPIEKSQHKHHNPKHERYHSKGHLPSTKMGSHQ